MVIERHTNKEENNIAESYPVTDKFSNFLLKSRDSLKMINPWEVMKLNMAKRKKST